MKDQHISQGKLLYYSKWIILDCDAGVVDFYRWLYTRRTGIKLHKSKHGAHISVVRGEEEGIEKGWWEYNLNGPVAEFRYSSKIRWNDPEGNAGYVWLDVQSEDLEMVRMGLGLEKHPMFGFHLTIGRKRA